MEYTSKSILSHYYSRIACSFNTSDAQSAESFFKNIINLTDIRIETEKACLMGFIVGKSFVYVLGYDRGLKAADL